MDCMKQTEQVSRVLGKLSWMARREGNLVRLEEQAGKRWLEEFEAEHGVHLPEDFRKIVSRAADGGALPDVCNIRYWHPLRNVGDREVELGIAYPPAERPEALRGEPVQTESPSGLPGQVLVMGSGRLGWSLITAGPCAGEVWTIGTFGVRRAPACTFAQWLELVLDGNLEPYLTFCLTGEGGRFGRSRRLDEVIGADFVWPEGADPSERCARWLDCNRFVHRGPTDSWAGYLRGQLCQTLGLLPQERDGKHVGPPWSGDPEQVAELARTKRFQCRGGGIRDLSFLEGLTNLKELDLWDNEIEDLGPLASLTGLRELWIPYNRISDLSPLAGLDKLVQLKVYGNQITSLEPLRGMTSLNVLNLRGNPLEPGTLACLRKCKRLGMLDLSNTGLGDISDLQFCRAWNLELYENPDLTGLEVISTMKRLSCLYLDTAAARWYDIPALAPQLTEHVELGGISLYVWPEQYFD